MLSDAAWARIAPLMPSADGRTSRPLGDHRQLVEGVIYRFRTRDRIHARPLAEADAAGGIDRMVSVDSTINRAYQHATNTTRGRAGGRWLSRGTGAAGWGLSTKIHQPVDGRSRPLAVAWTSGQVGDSTMHRERRVKAFDPFTYKGLNVIERASNDHEQLRGLATRHDKLAAEYRGSVILRAIRIWPDA